jgi:serine/threonine protein kinase
MPLDSRIVYWWCLLPFVSLPAYPPPLVKVMRGKFLFPEEEWGSVSEEAKDFVKKLMSKYPRRRPSAAEALAHPW